MIVDNISVEYAQHKVINNVTFTLEQGEIGCLLGPSGCGKTTLLRAIAGFERTVSGVIELGSEGLSSAQKLTPPERRKIGIGVSGLRSVPTYVSFEKCRFWLVSNVETKR